MTAAESTRESPRAVLLANFKRTAEALRTLEEYGKLVDSWVAGRFEVLRYDVYTLEKLTFTAMTSRQVLGDARLMVLVGDLPTLGDLTWIVGEALAGGADVIQLREKGTDDREWLRRRPRGPHPDRAGEGPVPRQRPPRPRPPRRGRRRPSRPGRRHRPRRPPDRRPPRPDRRLDPRPGPDREGHASTPRLPRRRPRLHQPDQGLRRLRRPRPRPRGGRGDEPPLVRHRRDRRIDDRRGHRGRGETGRRQRGRRPGRVAPRGHGRPEGTAR